MAKDTFKELNPRVEAQRVEADARRAERKRMFEYARTFPIRGPIPDELPGRIRYVVSEDCVTPDGKHHRPGEVISVKETDEPSLGWCPLVEHISQQKPGES